MRKNFCGIVEPAANFIFACPCKAISIGVEATESCHTIHTSGAVEVLALITYPSVVLQKQVVGAFIWSPVLGILLWRRHYSLPIAAFAQKQDTHSFRSNTFEARLPFEFLHSLRSGCWQFWHSGSMDNNALTSKSARGKQS